MDRIEDIIYAGDSIDIEMVKEYIESGNDINGKFGDLQETLLHFAARDGQIRIIRYLVENGANIDEEDIYRDTPLRNAVFAGYGNVIRYLLDNGSDKNHLNCENRTVMKDAKAYANPHIAKYIEQFDCQPLPTKGVHCDD